jgi:signal transduction histidine kinase
MSLKSPLILLNLFLPVSTKLKKLYTIAALVLWIAAGQLVMAQDTTAVDSLHAKIPVAHDSTMEMVFDALGRSMQSLKPHQALRIALRTVEISRKKSVLAEILALRNLANVYNGQGNKEEALRYFQEARNLGRAHPKERFGEAIALFELGMFLSSQELLSEGLGHILEASRIFEGLNKPRHVIRCHYEACIIQFRAKNFQQCIEEGSRVIVEYEKLDTTRLTYDDEFQQMSTYNTIGFACRELRLYDMAIKNLDKAEALAKKIDNEFWVGLINGNKGVVFKDIGRKDAAMASLREDYRISKKFAVWNSALLAAVSLSEVHLSLQQFDSSRRYLDSAKAMLKKDKDIMLAAKGESAYWLAVSKLKAAQRDYPRAYAALSRHLILLDSLNRQQEALNMAKVKAGYDLDRKQQEIEQLTRNNEMQQEHIRNQKKLFIVTLIGLILLVVLVINLVYNFIRQRNISKLVRQQRDEIEEKNMELEAQSMQLQENNQYIHSLNSKLEQKVADRTMALAVANKELDTFLYRSSHDIRRPITTLLGLDQVARHVLKDRQATLLFDKVVETARNMDNMLFKMQMIYELNKPAPDLEPANLSALLKDVVDSFRGDFERYGISYHLHIPEEISLLSSPSLLTIIFRNIVENAVLFRKTQPDAKPFIDMNVRRIDGHIEITVTDNGIGIEDRYHDQVFDLYFRASPASKGNGLGLYLVRKAIMKLNGTVSLASDYGVGTTLTIVLPFVH